MITVQNLRHLQKKLWYLVAMVALFLLLTVLYWQYGLPSSKQGDTLQGYTSIPPESSHSQLQVSTNLQQLKFKPLKAGKPRTIKPQGFTLLHIWSSWCPTCMAEHGLWRRVSQQWGIPIISLSYKDQAQRVISLLKQRGDPYSQHYQLDASQAVALGVIAVPEVWLLDGQGQVVARKRGSLSEKDWNKRERLLLGYKIG